MALTNDDKEFVNLSIQLAVEQSSHAALQAAGEIMKDVVKEHKEHCEANQTFREMKRLRWKLYGAAIVAIVMFVANVVWSKAT